MPSSRQRSEPQSGRRKASNPLYINNLDIFIFWIQRILWLDSFLTRQNFVDLFPLPLRHIFVGYQCERLGLSNISGCFWWDLNHVAPSYLPTRPAGSYFRHYPRRPILLHFPDGNGRPYKIIVRRSLHILYE